MAKHVNIAALHFDQEYLAGQPGAGGQVLRETARKLDALKGTAVDLVVLSEGIEAVAQTMEQAESVENPGPWLELYRQFAMTEHCHVAGSIKLKDSTGTHNSIVLIDPDGSVAGSYHKSRLTIGELEMGLIPGPGAVCLDTGIGRLGVAICFDLNFDVLRRQYAAMKPDIIVFSSMFHGGLMQAMWAYECRAFLVSALSFHGGGILDPFGRPLALTDCYNPVARTRVNLDRIMVHLDYNRDRFPDIVKRYGAEVRIEIPPNIGSALIFSESGKRTALDIAGEFGLELLDDYFARAETANTARRVGRG